VIVPPRVRPGQTVDLVLTYSYGNTGYQPVIAFTLPDGTDCPDVTVTSLGTPQTVTYAVPGNSYPGPSLMVPFTVQVSQQAKAAVLGLRLVPPAGVSGRPSPPSPAVPAFLTIATA
jgi:hypothetical protein